MSSPRPPHCKPGALFTDGGSTKGNVLCGVEGRLPAHVRFVPAHPLAGSEKAGAEHARADLFDGRLTILTPTDETDPAAAARVGAFWEALGCRVLSMPPDEHDRALATTSHLPHAAAAGVAGVTPPDWLPLTAGGFRDTTRVAAGDPALWAAIFLANRGPVLRALDDYTRRMAEFRRAAGGGRRGRPRAMVDRGETGARCSGKLKSGRPGVTPSASGCATSSTCSPTAPAAAASCPRRPAATCSKASLEPPTPSASPSSCWSIRWWRTRAVTAVRVAGHRQAVVHRAPQARRHGPRGPERAGDGRAGSAWPVTRGAHLPPLLRPARPPRPPTATCSSARCWPTTPSSRSSSARSTPTTCPRLGLLVPSSSPCRCRARRRRAREAQQGRHARPVARRDEGRPGALPRTQAASRPTASWKPSPRRGPSTARTRRSSGPITLTETARRPGQTRTYKNLLEGNGVRRHAGDPPAARGGRLVRERVRGQRRAS